MNAIDHNPRLSAEQLESLYLAAVELIKDNLKKTTDPAKRIEMMAYELAEKIYLRLCKLYLLKPDRAEQTKLRGMVSQVLTLAKQKKWKHFTLCQRLRFDVVEPFEDRVMLPRALKLSGTAKDKHNQIMDIFNSAP